MSPPRDRRSSRPSASSATRRTSPWASIAGRSFGGQVLDDDEVLLAPEHADGEVALDDPRVELEQRPAVAVVDRPADRHQREEGASLGIGPRRAEIDGLLAVQPQRHDDLPALTRRAGFVIRPAARTRGSAGRRRGPPDRGPRKGPRASVPAPASASTAPSGSPQHEQYRSETWFGSVHRAHTIVMMVIVAGSSMPPPVDRPIDGRARNHAGRFEALTSSADLDRLEHLVEFGGELLHRLVRADHADVIARSRRP